jgi:phosphate starvation-inducible protein PhoH
MSIKNKKDNKRKWEGGRASGSPSSVFKGAFMSKNKSKNRPNNNQQQQKAPQHFELKQIKPLTSNQEKTFTAYRNGFHLMLHGFAGTGKTFCALYLALQEVLKENSQYDKIIIIRSVVPSRDMGFLPGNMREKAAVYEEPYREICDTLFGRGDGYEILKMKGLVQFTTTSFLRGITFNRAIVILDESQNLSFQECDTVLTRMGDISRLLVCGDFRQTDLNKPHEKEGITQLMRITQRINSFQHIEFEKEDIVRSGLVRDYILKKSEMGL